MANIRNILAALATVTLAGFVTLGPRANADAAPCAGRYDVDATNGIVTDNDTKLVWQRVADATKRQYSLSVFYCGDLMLGGFTDWRLPTVFELQTIVDETLDAPAIDTMVFGGGGIDQNGAYWTSIRTPAKASDLFVVDFGMAFTGGSSWYADEAIGLERVRCVR